MRPSSLLLSAAVALAVLGSGVAAAASNGAQVRNTARQIVCPLESARQATTCCGPPTVPPVSCCAAESVACSTSVTIASSRSPSTAGHSVTVSGRVSTGTVGTTVELWQELPGKSFEQVAQTTTSGSGDYSFVRTAVTTNRKWHVTTGTVSSPTVSQQVLAVVTLMRSGRVHVTPNHAGERVLIERRSGHAWKVFERPKLNRSSSAALALPPARFTLRAVLSADKRNARSISRVVRFTP